LDFDPRWGDGSNDPWCQHCKQPITSEQKSVRVDFANDPHGFGGLSGLYHAACSKPFASLAHAMNMLSSRRF
jgi:hypothetical protein